MRARAFVITCCALVLLGIVAAGPAAATPLDKRTTFTFSTPFSVPGVTLPAGSYVFRLADDLRGRDVIQVLGADGTPYAMFFSLRTLRGEPVDKPEIQFMESAAGMPIAVKAWWYPADTQGYEFVYPRGRARLLANSTGEPVLAEPVAEETAFEWVTPEPAIEPVAPIAETPALVGEVAAVEETPALDQAPAVEPAPATLPKTGSPTATLLLVGALAALAAAGIRRARTVRT
jgi:LPXTG-motif cell wall-anchored protein